MVLSGHHEGFLLKGCQLRTRPLRRVSVLLSRLCSSITVPAQLSGQLRLFQSNYPLYNFLPRLGPPVHHPLCPHVAPPCCILMLRVFWTVLHAYSHNHNLVL